jgi:hypothetical protein
MRWGLTGANTGFPNGSCSIEGITIESITRLRALFPCTTGKGIVFIVVSGPRPARASQPVGLLKNKF